MNVKEADSFFESASFLTPAIGRKMPKRGSPAPTVDWNFKKIIWRFFAVIPECFYRESIVEKPWIPAFAGMTSTAHWQSTFLKNH